MIGKSISAPCLLFGINVVLVRHEPKPLRPDDSGTKSLHIGVTTKVVHPGGADEEVIKLLDDSIGARFSDESRCRVVDGIVDVAREIDIGLDLMHDLLSCVEKSAGCLGGRFSVEGVNQVALTADVNLCECLPSQIGYV